jgi:hypothetical protein
MIFALGIYASSEPAIWASIWKSKRCSACCVPGEFAARARPHRISRSFGYAGRNLFEKEEEDLARKTVLVCDNCNREVGEGKGATMRLNFSDARRGSKQADLCDNCAAEMPGNAVARRGRRPKSAMA